MSKICQASRAMLLASAALPLLMGAEPAFAQASTSGDTATPAAAATDQVQTPDQQTQSADDNKPAEGEQAVIVTGYRASLQSQANAKRKSVGFTDTIFAEDIGKFPDTNIAESVNRIPGVTITREVTGEGSNVTIRGLGTNFTKVLLNGTPVAVASVRFDAQSTNREVDLDLLPTELFTQLTVSK
jgi:outer membrane receptor for ferrienterochelin and colicin